MLVQVFTNCMVRFYYFDDNDDDLSTAEYNADYKTNQTNVAFEMETIRLIS